MNRLSCPDTHALLADLLAEDLAPEAAADLDAHLTDCPACRDHVESLLLQDRLLGELAGESLAPDMARRFREAAETATTPQNVLSPLRFTRRRWIAVASAIAAVLLAVVGAFLLNRKDEPTPESKSIASVGQLDQVTGEVFVVGKESRTSAQAGRKLFPGERVQVGDEGTAVVTLSDSSRLDLGPATSLSWPFDGGNKESSVQRLRLDEGSLVAHFSRDEDRDPMILETPHAEIVAGKSKLSLWNEADTTRIELEEGKARVTRRSDGQSVAMKPGAGMEIGREVPLSPRPLSPRLNEAKQTYGPHGGEILSLALSHDGQSMFVGCKSGEVRSWDVPGGKEKIRFLTGPQGLRGLALTSSGKLLVSGHDKAVRFWDPATGEELYPGPRPSSAVYGMGFSKDEMYALTCGFDRQIRRWDVTTGKLVKSLRCKDYRSDYDYPACMTFSVEGEQLAWGLKDNTTRLWDTSGPKELHVLRGHEGAVTATAFSPDGKKLATGSRDRTVKLWDTASGNLLATFRGHRHTVLAVAFSPDGLSLASGGSDTLVNLWDTTTGKERGTFKGHEKAVQVLAFTPDGRSLLTGSADETVRLWDLP